LRGRFILEMSKLFYKKSGVVDLAESPLINRILNFIQPRKEGWELIALGEEQKKPSNARDTREEKRSRNHAFHAGVLCVKVPISFYETLPSF
jgi:hypothetical protein